jgi:putative FmdB family regulatory protein
MPIYEFQCRDCHRTFEIVQSVSEHESSAARCPDCKGTNVERVMSTVYAVTSKKS